MIRRLPGAMSNFGNTIVLAFLSIAGLCACQPRARLPIVVQAPAPAGGSANPVVSPSVNVAINDGQATGQSSTQTQVDNSTDNAQVMPSLPTQTGGNGATTGPTAPDGSSGGLTPTPNGSQPGPAMMTITTTLDDGTTSTLTWNGMSLMGNDKWDVVAQ